MLLRNFLCKKKIKKTNGQITNSSVGKVAEFVLVQHKPSGLPILPYLPQLCQEPFFRC